jgi:hypothetical protein
MAAAVAGSGENMNRSFRIASLLLLLVVSDVAAFAVSVSLSPNPGGVVAGGQLQFTATVSGTTNSVVIWSLSGSGCSGIACGQITGQGLYLAPATPPNPPIVTVTATSLADLSQSGSASVFVGAALNATVSVSPASVGVVAGQQQLFNAFVTGATNTAVTWGVMGSGCSGTACGSISSGGVYTAPSTVPTPAVVTVTATSVANPLKSSTATVTILPPVAVSMSPSTAQVVTGKTQQFTAIVINTTNTAVTWSLRGAGCSGNACGTVSSSGLYTAPATVPSPAQVIVTATSVADTTKTASATVTILPPVAVSISPTTAQVVAGKTQQFAATVINTTNTTVTWSLSGSGCSGNTCGAVSSSGLYTAPATVPSPARVIVTAASVADTSKSASATVTILPPVAVSISPTTARVVAGKTQQFTASVINTTNTAVTWSLSGAGCSGNTCGTISSSGLYTAPGTLPSPAQVIVTATSVADTNKTASATVTILPPVAVSISPATAELVTGKTQQFTATVKNTTNTAVTWSLNGTGCSGATCGTVSSSGLYTAPAAVPSPAQVSVTATSVADPTKSSTASVTILHSIVITVSPGSAQVVTGKTQQFTATVDGTSDTSVTWKLSGTGCSGATCGAISASGLYTAPGAVPSPPQVTVTATSVADTTKSASATVTVLLPVIVSISPTTAKVVAGKTQQFTATVTNTTNTAVTWSLHGAGCSGAGCGTISASGLYTAPGTVPSPALVTVVATSAADSTKTASASVTILPPVAVSVSPTTAQVVAGKTQQFTATVTGTTNTAVTWSLSGVGCSGATCGAISASGLFTAPAAVPNPAQVTVTATANADITKSSSVTVTILPPVVVHVSPTTVQLVVLNTLQFTATVTGTTNTAVTWSLAGTGCSGATCGTISSTGLYTAPAAVPTPAQVTVTATSKADSTKSSSAVLTILPTITVSVSPGATQVATGTQQQFTASVNGTSDTAVTWSLKGAGCSGAACGTISQTGLYTAPDAVPNPAQVTLTATSVADKTKSASATVTIIVPLVIRVTPVTTVVAVDGTEQFRAAVSGTQNTAVTWSATGPGCSGTECGTITSGGLYTAPASLPSPATVKITAASQADPSQTGSATLTLIASNNARLLGQYAFLFKGVENNGVYQAGGTFTADGNGHLTSGLEDANNSTGPATNIPFTGTYQVGGDGRGLMTFSSTLGSYSFKFVLDAPGAKGKFIEFDQSGIHGSGIIERQDPSAFATTALSGSYALKLTGSDSKGDRIGAIGDIYCKAGFISIGSLDVNDGGAVSPTYAPFDGDYRVESSGRGTVGLNIPGFEGGSFTFAIYVVSSSEYFMISIDQLSSNNPVFSGPAELQSGTFSSESFKGPSVFSLSGNNGSSTQATVGQFVFEGVSGVTATLDQNSGGTITTGATLTGAFDMQINGRGTLNLDNNDGSTTVWYFYAIAPNQAFLLDASTAFVSDGELDPQLTVPPFINSDAFGTYIFASGEALSNATSLLSGVIDFDGGNVMGQGGVTGVADIAQESSLASSQTLAGTYNISASLNDGRGTMLLTSPNASTIALWVINESELVGLSISPSNTHPTVLHFEQ